MILKIFRKIVRIILKRFIRKSLFDYSGIKTIISLDNNYLSKEETSDYIFKSLKDNEPLMISRFGYTELNTLFRYENLIKMNKLEKIYQWAETMAYPLSENCRLNNIYKLSGFFPVTEETLYLFRKEMIKAMRDINLLGSWVKGEDKYIKHLSKVKVCNLIDIEPYFSSNPWSLALEGKKVLVIHPFSEDIENQYINKRNDLFRNKNILPEFDLKTLKTPITYPGGNTIKKNWFEILDYLTAESLKLDFDIAIIGCGAYGMPLASRIKKAGKKSIHLGGSVQILFGIKGKRWDQMEEFKKMYNKFWIYPSSKNKVFKHVENGCYW
tara:strand:- start:3818 stop:4792 length:975 start_codon:yes stop_codon:yes gene_type:complete